MTLTRTDLSQLVDTSNLTAYAGDSKTGAADQLIVCMVCLSDTVAPDTPNVANNPWGIANASWVLQQNILAGSGIERFCCFTGTTGGSAPGADTFDISFTNGATGCLMWCQGFTSNQGGPPVVAQSVTGGPTTSASPSLTMGALGGDSWVEAGWMIGRLPTATPDSGWTERFDNSHATPNNGLWVVDSNGVTSDTTPSGTWVSGSWVGIGVEIREPRRRPKEIGRLVVPGFQART